MAIEKENPTVVTVQEVRETELVVSAQNGDRNAFSELVRVHARGVFNVVYHMCGDPLVAEDAAQETFLRAWQSLSSYRPQMPPQLVVPHRLQRRAGYAPQGETHPARLTSAIEEKRRQLIPTGTKWSVAEIAEAAKTYQRAKGERLTIAWVMLGGVNHGPDEIEALGSLFRGVPLRFNIIDVNDARPDGFRRPTEAELEAFRDALWTLGFPVVRRYSGGFAKHAACGMLASVSAA